MDFEGKAFGFDFDGVSYRCEVRHGQQKADRSDVWWVGVNFVNRSDEKKRCPYAIEVKAVGLFVVTDDVPEDKREAFVYESGAALVYGAIREMVATISGRSVHGPMMLPTASFFGSFQERDQSESDVEQDSVEHGE